MITRSRLREMSHLFWEEDGDAVTTFWRDDCTAEELELLEKWDDDYDDMIYRMAKRIVELNENKSKPLRTANK